AATYRLGARRGRRAHGRGHRGPYPLPCVCALARGEGARRKRGRSHRDRPLLFEMNPPAVSEGAISDISSSRQDHFLLDEGHERNERPTRMVIGRCTFMIGAQVVGGLTAVASENRGLIWRVTHYSSNTPPSVP